VAKTAVLKWFDLLPVALVLVVAGLWLWWQFSAPAGTVAVITDDSGQQTISLSEDDRFTLVGKDGLSVTIVVKDGKLSVAQADCPDQLCVHTAPVSKAGDTVACVPAGIAVTVEGDADDAPDAVAR